MHIAMPIPPPIHNVARPTLASRFCISCRSVTRMRAPDVPTGGRCDRTAVDVDDLRIPADVPVDGERLRGERLVGLDRSRSATFQPAFFERPPRGGIGPDP